MLDLLTDPQVILSFLTLAVLEIVLGIDNLLFVQIIAGRVAPERRDTARRVGLALALVTRLILLAAISWVAGLTAPLVDIWGFALSWRDVILIAGGLFLLAKATTEIHHTVDGDEEHGAGQAKVHLSFAAAVVQIALLDIVFSLDSVITAVGMAQHLPVMVAAVIAAMIVMIVAAAPVGRFVERHQSVKMLCLSFLLLVGVALIADGLHFHIPKGYLYFAIAFSALVEGLNILAKSRRRRRRATSNVAPS
ncbi:TerC family protein [Tistrella mobilis]|jgi:predicted tellurium resistance membrane protein TerC|uniref:TerC family protein n=1 Tax=Tistrella mobilis TaxID=171437 RepID=UPI00355671B0